jgi:aminocarboxymuconate-semialdehyde decarboxylase
MEKHKIDHAIIFPLSQLYGNQLSKELVYDAHKRHNDFNWGLQDGHDSKFTSSFTVNPRYIDQALEEIQRCVDMGMSILGLCTHYIPETINGKPNTNKLYIAFGEGEQDKQILDLANKHGLAIQFHPYDMEHIINIPNTRWRHHLGFMASLTEDSYATTTSNNYHNDYPNINFHFAHGGGSSLITFGRRKQGSL